MAATVGTPGGSAGSRGGLLDRLVGGPELRRGRRHPTRLTTGDPLDWWRVEKVMPGRLLGLRAEMRLPWLELCCETDGAGVTVFGQRALYHPYGLLGHASWFSVLPFHGVVFGGMQRNIARSAATGPPDGAHRWPTPAGSGER